MNEFANFIEYVVEKKPEGKYLMQRVAMIAGYIIFALVFFFCFIFVIPKFFPASGILLLSMVALLPMSLYILVLATWRYVNIEYEYSIVSGVMTVATIYGMKNRKNMLEVKLKDMSIIAPYQDKYKEQADSSEIVKRYEAVSSMNHPDVYFCIFNNEKNEKSVLFFEATNKTLVIAKFYNSTATIPSTSLLH